MLCAAYRRERSLNGHDLSVLKSGLQKYIRRGEGAKAVWCAGELMTFAEAPERDQWPRIFTNVRHRLMVIFLEDVGDVGMWRTAAAYLAEAGCGRTAQAKAAAISGWAQAMAAVPKSRAGDHVRAVASLRDLGGPDGPRLFAMAGRLYPAIAALLNAHRADPRSGDAREAQWRGALAEAIRERSQAAYLWAWAIATKGASRSATGGRKPVWQIFAAIEAGCRSDVAALVPLARAWYKDMQNLEESFLCWMTLLIAHVEDLPFREAMPAGLRVPARRQGPMRIDDYVLDVHVAPAAPGRRGGRTRFAEEGSVVSPESPTVNAVWKCFYEDCLRLQDWAEPRGPPLTEAQAEASAEAPQLPDDLIDSLYDDYMESLCSDISAPAVSALDDLLAELAEAPEAAPMEAPEAAPAETGYEFIARARPLVSPAGVDAYFARAPGGGIVVMKGPYADHDTPARAAAMAEWKAANGLPAAGCRVAALVPDRWLRGLPTDIRDDVARARPAWFLVTDSVIGAPPAAGALVAWDDPGLRDSHEWAPLRRWVGYSAREKSDYVLALYARYVAGACGLGDSHFRRAGGRLYSLSEGARVAPGSWVRITAEIGPARAELARDWVSAHWRELEAEICCWSVPEAARERWRDVKSRLVAIALFTGLTA